MKLLPRPLHRLIGSLTLLSCLAASASEAAPTGTTAPPSLETAIKATYLYKLAPFVDWPGEDSAGRPFTICIVGDDPFGPVLDHAVATQHLGQRPIQIARMDVISLPSPCDIAYLAGSANQSVSAALHLLHNAPVLTVTDSSDTPGIVNYTVQDGHVRFLIDNDAAQESGLTISSKLLGLALAVKSTKSVVRP